ncbi:hypothetical protein BSKO_03934 [Bryopsis sp. KO-2023]|nr:hypothetical protein BSKO_03934 [Bryopsis sp. KO-2023]
MDTKCGWFDHAVPGLLTNRTIRNFLTSYREDSWPEVVKLTLLYGVQTLQQQFGHQRVSLERIREEVRQGVVANTVQESIPEIADQVERLRENLAQVLGELSTSESIDEFRPPQRETPLCLPPPERSRESSEFSDALTGKSPEQRAGLPTAREKEKMEEIYPSWWGDGSLESKVAKENAEHRGEKTAAAVKRNPGPRLAFSLPPEMASPVDLDDLVTAEHLQVKSSGYGKSDLDELLDSIGVPRMENTPAKENGTRPVIQTTPAKDATFTEAPKIQDLYSAVETTSEPPKLWKSQRSGMEIADSILSNPWTSRFMNHSPDQQAPLSEIDLSKISLGQPLPPTANTANKPWTPPEKEMGLGMWSCRENPAQQSAGGGFGGGLEDLFVENMDKGFDGIAEVKTAPSEYWLDGSNTLNRRTSQHGITGNGPPASKTDAKRGEAWAMDFGHLGAPRKEKKTKSKKADKEKRDLMRLAKICEMEKTGAFSSSASTTSF